MRIIIAGIVLFAGLAQAQVSTSRNYNDVVSHIRTLAARNPQTAKLFTLGYSDAGVAIEGIKVGTGAVHHLLVAAHHGNEYGSTELALAFIDSLVQAPISGQTLYVVPVLNIDGYNNRNRYERINGQYVDLNRDYPGPCGSEGPYLSRSTKALADLVAREDIVAAATIHTYWPAVVYPWGISTQDLDTPYTPLFINLAKLATETSGYQIGNSAALIYPADGTLEDYVYWKHGVWSLLFEVGKSHNPRISDLKEIVADNVPGLRKMFVGAPSARAAKHDFTGKCDLRLRALDLHLE
jgi:hypothetical protein